MVVVPVRPAVAKPAADPFEDLVGVTAPGLDVGVEAADINKTTKKRNVIGVACLSAKLTFVCGVGRANPPRGVGTHCVRAEFQQAVHCIAKLVCDTIWIFLWGITLPVSGYGKQSSPRFHCFRDIQIRVTELTNSLLSAFENGF